MKKRWIIGGVLVLLLGGAGTAFAFSKNEKTARIREALDGNTGDLSGLEKEWMDMDGNGEITTGDLVRAKVEALLHTGKPTVFFAPTEAKRLGRTSYHEDTGTLWCSLSCTGIEFIASGKTCTLQLTADSAYSSGEDSAARYAVYVDDQMVRDEQLTEKEKQIELEISESGSRVKLIKLSESSSSSMGIRAVAVRNDNADGISFKAAESKEKLIEFIGDSITCGYGVDGAYNVDPFRTANEDATKAYAYRTAQKLNVDYSLVSFSGYGILSGWTGNGKINKKQIVPKYYEMMGHCAARLEGDRLIQEDSWDFAVQPDLIVINLGTNDASYTQSDADLQREFTESYAKFLKKVRKLNPDAPIICALGTMGDTLFNALEKAVDQYQQESGDTKIRTLHFETQSEADGLAVDWHPSAKTHDKASDTLCAFIREWLAW